MADKYRSRQESTDSLDTSPSTAEEYSEDDKDGYDIDDYQIIKTVGTGTFGRVLLCRNKSTDEYGAMKVLNLSDVIRLKQVEHVKNEKNILIEIRHPFIVNMLWCNRDDSCIYMLFEYVCGGELFSYLRNAGRFSTSTGNFYSTEIISALEYLHSKCIVYRDLKPENLLLDKDGHLKITDFGFAKKLTDRTWTLCGTPEYLAPEIIQSKGHNKAVDWWALGILIYEMLAGFPPFYDDNPFGIYEKILSGKIEWPKHLDPVAKDLIKKLLIQDRTKRLGNMKDDVVVLEIEPRNNSRSSSRTNSICSNNVDEDDDNSDDSDSIEKSTTSTSKWNYYDFLVIITLAVIKCVNYFMDILYKSNKRSKTTPKYGSGADDIKRHRWFKGIDWQEVLMRKLKPPIVPKVLYEGDTSNFDEYPEIDWKSGKSLEEADLKLFDDF